MPLIKIVELLINLRLKREYKKKVVGERGFEPPTNWSQTSCATKLRYSPHNKLSAKRGI